MTLPVPVKNTLHKCYTYFNSSSHCVLFIIVLLVSYSRASAAVGNPAYLCGVCRLLKLHDVPVEVPLLVCPLEILYALGDGPAFSARYSYATIIRLRLNLTV